MALVDNARRFMMEECKILFATLDTKYTYDQYFSAIRKMPIAPGKPPRS